MKEEFNAGIDKAEKEDNIEKIQQMKSGAEAMGMSDVVERASQAINNLELAKEEIEAITEHQEAEAEAMGGDMDEIKGDMDAKSEEAKAVVEGAENQIGELSAENEPGLEKQNDKDLYVENLSNKMKDLELKLDEVEAKRESLEESIANLFGENSDNFKAMLYSSGGWPSNIKDAAWYGFGELGQSDEIKYRELQDMISPLYRSLERIKRDHSIIYDNIKFIERIETSDDEIDILKQLEDPTQTDILFKLDALSQSKTLEDSEIFDVMRGRISNLENIYNPESKTFNSLQGPHGDTPEYELALRLGYFSGDLLERMKDKGGLGGTFDKAYAEHGKIKEIEEERNKKNAAFGVYDEIYP
jgi:hypothetical protein